ncbi:MAG: ribosome biogenesis GTPase Der [Actinomycetia bacterium]|nr:ribosome biogenesis GTPase Der [Actinomycetes bacterium]MCP3909844.1 ribosome biogenesis GTPase Der [Actinomycetes bacterium]MCP4084201.1 ribosome biogenesis GTPase Der [Actinomycetes bacterium]
MTPPTNTESSEPKPVVVIVGRPNVGKSTLVNRILGRREAIVEETPGVTRDRKAVDAEWQGTEFTLIDTGGWLPGGSELDEKVSRQAEKAVQDADVVILVADVAVGLTQEDASVAEWLRKAERPVLLAVNKVDDVRREPGIWEFMQLGLGEPYPISAIHGTGSADMLDRAIELFPEIDDDDMIVEEGERIFSVALVGRPNVGKSTLFNRLIGDDRSVVHDMPGTTRDTVDTVVETDDGPVRFIDTAGMRRKGRIDEDTEYYSMLRALSAVDQADVALLIVDASEGVTGQDQRLAERVDGAGCPVVVVLNKWETMSADHRADVEFQVKRKLHFLGESPVLRLSALTGRGVQRLMPALNGAIDEYQTRVPTRRVNQVLAAAQQAQPAPRGGRVLYATQGATDPPTFTLFTNKELPRTYLRYLERSIREAFGLGTTPVKLRVRRRG